MKTLNPYFILVVLFSLLFTLSGNSQCAPDIPGYLNIGIRDGHGYYLSMNNARPTDAQAAAEALGGYLMVINDADENDFIETYIDELAYIGFNDANTEGTLASVNGEPVTYTNIDPCSFCQANDADNDFVVIEPWGNGEWSFSNFWNARKYIVEIPCSTSNNSNECSFATEWLDENYFTSTGNVTQVFENANDYEIRFTSFEGGGQRRLIKWTLDKLGNEIQTSDVTFSFPSGMDIGRVSTIGDYFFMHDLVNLNPQLNKYDFSGNTIFSKTYNVNTTISNPTYAETREAWEDEDGLLITGHEGNINSGQRQGYLIKTDLDGNEQWQTLLPIENSFISINVQGRSSDGGYYLLLSPGIGFATKIIKIDETGNILWTYSTTKNSNIVDREFLGESADGSGFFFVQNDVGTGSQFGFLGYKLNPSTGALVWEKEINDLFGISSEDYGIVNRASTTSIDGGILVDFIYLENSPFVANDKYGKIDGNGNLVWGYEKPRYNRNFSIPRLGTSDGGFLLVGNFSNDGRLATKIGSDGSYNPICEGGNNGATLTANCDFGFTGSFPDNPFVYIDPAQNPNGEVITWDDPTGTTTCPGGIVTVELVNGFPSGSTFTVGNFDVLYKVSDACGNEQFCGLELRVRGPAPIINCNNDITINATSAAGAIVNYDFPTATMPAGGTCSYGTFLLSSGQNTASGSQFPIGTTEVEYYAFRSGSPSLCEHLPVNAFCTFNVTVLDDNTGGGCPGDITGFTTLGEFGTSKYYISNANSRPVDAQAVAASFGGYLVSINSQAENDFIQQGANGLTYIGLTDQNSEGNLEWFNGDPLTYQNVNPCGFCNENSGSQDYGVIQPWDGGWSFSNFFNGRKYIMEIPCDNGGGGNDGCGFITSFAIPNVYSLSTLDFSEDNDNYFLDIKYVGINGPNENYERKTLSKDGAIESTANNPFPIGGNYAAQINGLTIDLSYSLSGSTQWIKNIPITTSDPDFDQITSVRVVEDENGLWIVGGYHYGNAATWRTFTIRTDLNGNFFSQNIYPTIPDFPVFLNQKSTNDGGVYFLLRNSAATGVLYRVDANGALDWTKNIIGDLVSNRILLIGETADASALYIGINNQINTAQLRKYNTNNGDLIWDENLAFGFGMGYTGGVVTQDGGVVLAVSYTDPGTNVSEAEYMKIDGAGNEVWRHDFPNGLRSSRAIGATGDGGFIFHTGYAGVGRIIKVNSDGLFNPACASNEKPDLEPSNLKLNDFQYQVGQTATLNFRINNNSLTTVNSTYSVSTFIRPFNGTGSTDIATGTFTYSNTPYGITNFTENIVIPNVLQGSYKIVMKVDLINFVDELLENNNEVVSFNFQVEPGTNNLSDLTVSNVTNLPASGESGEVVFFNFDLNNIGDAVALGSYTISMYLSTNATYNPNNPGFFAGEIPTGDTPIGTTAAVPAAITVPFANNGNYNLFIIADDFNDIAELNENNNVISVPFIIGQDGGGCPASILGYTSLGEFNGSAYYLSGEVTRPNTAQNNAVDLGGNLAVINSQAENDFLHPQINELVYIGINDATTENTLEWVDGSAVGFTNFDVCSFCNENTPNLDYVIMHGWNGGWSWSSVWNQRKYIVEIPCETPLNSPNVNNTLIALPTQGNEKLTLGTLMPNPANEYIFASIFSPTENEIEIQIMDARGVLVKNEVVGVHEGSNTIEVNIADLPSGFYMMHIPNAQKKNARKRFVKVKD